MEEQLDRVTNYVVANYHDWLIVPVIGLAGYFVIRTTDKYVARFFDRAEYDRTLEILFQKTIKVFLWSVVLILALANIGFDVTGFVAGLGVMGFIVGFAGQLGIEPDHFFAQPLFNNIFQTDESSAAYKEYLRGVDLYV